MTTTKIEWATKVWNPLRGCTKVSEGCRNCYAIRQAHRFSGPDQPYEGLTKRTDSGLNWTGKVKLVPEILGLPLKWKKSERIFVNSMSDLFHESVDEKYIAKVFSIMALSPHHVFQVLTKRPKRMRELLNSEDFQFHVGWFASQACDEYGIERPKFLPEWPYHHVWIGTSVENQKAADERIPQLLKTPAAVRFLSCEPLLGTVDLGCDLIGNIHWVIVGGESGPNARAMHPEWARELRAQCRTKEIPFFFKQWGEWAPLEGDLPMNDKNIVYLPDNDKAKPGEYTAMNRIGKNKAGRLLDGREWNEFPEVSK